MRAGSRPISTSSINATARALFASVWSRSVTSVGPSVCVLPLTVSVTRGCHRIPVFRDHSILVHADDVERHHLIRSERCGIAPDIVHEDVVAVLEHADVLSRRSGLLEHRQKLDEGFKPGRDEGVVLDVVRVRQFTHRVGVAGQTAPRNAPTISLLDMLSSANAPDAKVATDAATRRVCFIGMVLSGESWLGFWNGWVSASRFQASAPPSTPSSCISFRRASCRGWVKAFISSTPQVMPTTVRVGRLPGPASASAR
jgi:hypothetical protein